MPASEPKDRRGFHRKLLRFLWSEPMAPLLVELDCGWLDGGCHTCAKGIYVYLLASGTLDPDAVSFQIISDRRNVAHHVAVAVDTDSGTWYLDGNGMSSSHRLLRYWEHEEHVTGVWINAQCTAQEVEEAFPSLGGIALILAGALFAAFGPFSPAWLEMGNAQRSKPTREEEEGAYDVYELSPTGQRTGREAGPFPEERAKLIAHTLNALPTSLRYHYGVLLHSS
jgi:hypothetical protein